MLEEGLEVARDEHVHVYPYTSVRPYDQQTHEVPVHPCFLVVQIEEFAPVHSRPLSERGDVDDAKRERIGEQLQVLLYDLVLAQVSVRP